MPTRRVSWDEIYAWYLTQPRADPSTAVADILGAYMERGPRRAEAALDDQEFSANYSRFTGAEPWWPGTRPEDEKDRETGMSTDRSRYIHPEPER
jgi:hypothetical protein